MMIEMKITIEPGTKSPDDFRIFVETQGKEMITWRQVFALLDLLFEQEDRNYPPPALGRTLPFRAIEELYDRVELDVIIKNFIEKYE